MDMKISAYGLTDVGLKRDQNEDNFLVDIESRLFVVADGMGGHKGGDLASQLAVETSREVVKKHLENHQYISPRMMLEEIYTEASSRIYNCSLENNNQLKGMGTTLVMAYINDDEIFIGNVGDSRAYFYNDLYMWQITEDHSLVNDHIRAGLLKDSDINSFQSKNVITRCVGFESSIRCDIVNKKLNDGDSFLLCSDGLWNLVEDSKIYEICKNHCMEDAVKLCIEAAKNKGGNDNITALVIEVSK